MAVPLWSMPLNCIHLNKPSLIPSTQVTFIGAILDTSLQGILTPWQSCSNHVPYPGDQDTNYSASFPNPKTSGNNNGCSCICPPLDVMSTVSEDLQSPRTLIVSQAPCPSQGTYVTTLVGARNEPACRNTFLPPMPSDHSDYRCFHLGMRWPDGRFLNRGAVGTSSTIGTHAFPWPPCNTIYILFFLPSSELQVNCNTYQQHNCSFTSTEKEALYLGNYGFWP